MGEDAVQAERSSIVGPNESHDLPVPSPSPANSISPLSPGVDGGQASAITVLTLLDKLVHMLDTVQENQRKMEERQVEIEGTVRNIQSDVIKLSKSHSSTSNSVGKLLEKSRKMSLNLKEVKEKIDKQAVQVKKLEVNHAHLLKRDNFKVLIFQEEREIPTEVFVKDSMRQPLPAEEEAPGVNANCTQEDGMQTISLSSDDEMVPHEDEDAEDALVNQDMASERSDWSRAEKIKRSSLKKVDTLKRAFSRQTIEKKMNKIGSKIVSPEQREKLKKSFTPNHPKSPSTKSSSFKVAPLTFNVKKVRDGEASPKTMQTAEFTTEPVSSPETEQTFSEVHTELNPALEGAQGACSSQEDPELTVPSACSPESELPVLENGDAHPDLPATLQQPDQAENEEEGEEKQEEMPTETKKIEVEAMIQAAPVAVE
uniref:Caveolae associated protein 2a n=1 Tax=Paramormyrops kingsleyae TaxID=1676925 RepID=A0A3B3SN77_9TELE|nr:caveolae-associated protein 2-like [Paramormyrops kingsleyae]